MPEPIQVTLIKPDFFFYSHNASFVRPSSSQRYAGSTEAGNIVGDIETGVDSLNITIKELEPGYRVLKPIPLVIERVSNEGFTASFSAANIHTTGDNWLDAAIGLRSLILDVYDSLIAESPHALGPGPARQLATLLRYVQKNHSQ